MHHSVWHGIRNYWNSLTESEKFAIAELGWKPNGLRAALKTASERTRPIINNGSGEDFLFFHRQMVTKYRELSTQAGVKPISWPEIPQPGAISKDSPTIVPKIWPIAIPTVERRFRSVKSDEFFWSRMRWWDFEYKSSRTLSSMTLGELGALMEFSVHNDMHIRFSAAARDPLTNELLQLGRDDHDFAPKWDSPKYNWLGEFYSSHVNPYFWGLHGWIDDRIEDWYQAHEAAHPGEVERVTMGGVSWFKQGKWVEVNDPWLPERNSPRIYPRLSRF